SWWEFYRLADLPPEDLRDEKHGLVGLELVETVGGTENAPIQRYRFPEQDHDIRKGQTLHVDAETEIGTVEGLDLGARTIDVKKRKKARDQHPSAVFAHERVRTDVLEDALEDLAERVVLKGIDSEGPFRAARDLLLRARPRLRDAAPGPLARTGETSLEA